MDKNFCFTFKNLLRYLFTDIRANERIINSCRPELKFLGLAMIFLSAHTKYMCVHTRIQQTPDYQCADYLVCEISVPVFNILLMAGKS